jgi:hypothetical protein
LFESVIGERSVQMCGSSTQVKESIPVSNDQVRRRICRERSLLRQSTGYRLLRRLLCRRTSRASVEEDFP